jgi:hypothetical protein
MMLKIHLPLGKALIVTERIKDCRDCYFYETLCEFFNPGYLACSASVRKDGKDVIFKMIDLPEGKPSEKAY